MKLVWLLRWMEKSTNINFYDARRQGSLEKYGVKFLRFSNKEIKYHMFSVLLEIEEKVKELIEE